MYVHLVQMLVIGAPGANGTPGAIMCTWCKRLPLFYSKRCIALSFEVGYIVSFMLYKKIYRSSTGLVQKLFSICKHATSPYSYVLLVLKEHISYLKLFV